MTLASDSSLSGRAGRSRRDNNLGWDVRSAAHGRIQVKARSHASRHLNWFHIKNVDANTFDYLVLIEFEADLSLAGAWGMTHAAISDHAHSVVVDARGNRITKLAIRGDWKTRVDAIDLAIAQRPR